MISVHLHCKSVVLNMNKLTRPCSGISGFREGSRGLDFVCEERGMVGFEVDARSESFDYSLCAIYVQTDGT